MGYRLKELLPTLVSLISSLKLKKIINRPFVVQHGSSLQCNLAYYFSVCDQPCDVSLDLCPCRWLPCRS